MRKISVSKKQASLLALATVLIATNVASAIKYFTTELSLSGKVTIPGQMQVYETDGLTVKNTLAFEEFYSGTPDTDTTKYTLTRNKVSSGIWQPRSGSTPADTKIQPSVDGTAQLNLDLFCT